MVYMGDNYHRCAKCLRILVFGEVIFYSKKCACHRYTCQKCSERKTMPNIEITAKVDGKIVPLNTISTESFEAIKALEKSKEIPVPVVRIGYHCNEPRLLLRIDNDFRKFVTSNDASMIAINLKTGDVVHWGDMGIYNNVKPL